MSTERQTAKALWVEAIHAGKDFPCPYWSIAACFFHNDGNCMGSCRHRDEYLTKAQEAK